MANRDPQAAVSRASRVPMDLASHPQDVSKLGLEDSDIVRLQDGRVGTKEELGIIVPRREGQIDSEPARDIAQPPETRAARLAVLEERYNATIGRTPIHEGDAPTPTAIKLELIVKEGELQGTKVAVQGTDMEDATNKLIQKMDKLGEALLG